MNLTPEQQAILNGEKGEVLAKVMKTLVMYGDAFGAEKLVPVTSKYGHTVISFGINTMKPVYDLYDQLLASGRFRSIRTSLQIFCRISCSSSSCISSSRATKSSSAAWA